MFMILIIAVVTFAILFTFHKGYMLKWWGMLAVLLASLVSYMLTSLLLSYLLFEVFEVYNAKASIWDLIPYLLLVIIPIVVAMAVGALTLMNLLKARSSPAIRDKQENSEPCP